MSFEFESLPIGERALWFGGGNTTPGEGAKETLKKFVSAVKDFNAEPTVENSKKVFDASSEYMSYAFIDDDSLNYLSPEFIEQYGDVGYEPDQPVQRNIFNRIYNEAAKIFVDKTLGKQVENADDKFYAIDKNIEWVPELASYVTQYARNPVSQREMLYARFGANRESAEMVANAWDKMDLSGNTPDELIKDYYEISRSKNEPIDISGESGIEKIKKYAVPVVVAAALFFLIE